MKNDLLITKEFYNNLRNIYRSNREASLEDTLKKVITSYENTSHRINVYGSYAVVDMEIEGYSIYRIIHDDSEADMVGLIEDMSMGYWRKVLNHTEYTTMRLMEEIRKL